MGASYHKHIKVTIIHVCTEKAHVTVQLHHKPRYRGMYLFHCHKVVIIMEEMNIHKV